MSRFTTVRDSQDQVLKEEPRVGVTGHSCGVADKAAPLMPASRRSLVLSSGCPTSDPASCQCAWKSNVG